MQNVSEYMLVLALCLVDVVAGLQVKREKDKKAATAKKDAKKKDVRGNDDERRYIFVSLSVYLTL